MLKDSTHSFGDVVHYNVQINFVLLVTLCVERMSERDHVRMVEFFHNLELSIFIALILVHFLDRHHLSSLCH